MAKHGINNRRSVLRRGEAIAKSTPPSSPDELEFKHDALTEFARQMYEDYCAARRNIDERTLLDARDELLKYWDGQTGWRLTEWRQAWEKLEAIDITKDSIDDTWLSILDVWNQAPKYPGVTAVSRKR